MATSYDDGTTLDGHPHHYRTSPGGEQRGITVKATAADSAAA
ncbi:hypothetical protein [Streptomyces sp. NPDC059466]